MSSIKSRQNIIFNGTTDLSMHKHSAVTPERYTMQAKNKLDI